MRYLKPFNEASSSSESDRVYDILSTSIDEIRNVLIDFEDAGIIKYNLSTLPSFVSRYVEMDTYIRNASISVSNRNERRDENDRINEVTLRCEVTLSYKLDNQTLNDYSKDKYEDLSVCLKRIESIGYGCSLDTKKFLPEYGKGILNVIIPI
jgi:hypothetical protein